MALTNCYADWGQFADELRISDASDNAKAERAIEAASRQIDAHCNRRFWQDATVKTRIYRPDDPWYCRVDDISTTTGLVVKTDTGADGSYANTLTVSTHFLLMPYNAEDEVPARPYTMLELVDSSAGSFPVGYRRPSVQVTAKFGWASVPADVTKACLTQAHFLFKAGDAALGAAQLGLDGSTLYVGDLHRTARGLLEPYVRHDT